MIYLGLVLAAIGVAIVADLAFWPVILIGLGLAVALSTVSRRHRRHRIGHRRHRGEGQEQPAA
jgi:hypothetical protein